MVTSGEREEGRGYVSIGLRNTNSEEFSSVTQSCPTLCDPHQLQHARLPCPSPIPRVYSNSCPLSRWCHPAISILLPSIPPSIRIFSSETVLCIRWPKYWSFSFRISPSNEYSGLISFRIDWLGLHAVLRDSQGFSSTTQLKSSNSLAFSFLYSPTLTSIHENWKNHSFAWCCSC